MLIITADDYGKSRPATDSILECQAKARLTTASAMVFMEDSARAAALSLETGMEVGLHLNFTQPFTAGGIDDRLRTHQDRVVAYLTKHKLSQVIYNPFLSDSFLYSFSAQKDEFQRRYGRLPDLYNGHHHVHLCANTLLGGMIPKGARVRRTFTFRRHEQNTANFLYRKYLDSYVSRRFISTDCFFNINPLHNLERIGMIINRAFKENIEILAHPEKKEETEFLLSDKYHRLIRSVPCGRFTQLQDTH